MPNREECGPCPVFTSYTLALALQQSKRHGKISVRGFFFLDWKVDINISVNCNWVASYRNHVRIWWLHI